MPPEMTGLRNTVSVLNVWLSAAVILLLVATPSWAGFDEQFAISAKALSLANSVTAYPPGVMSIHYNPAGLSLLKGDVFSQGITLPIIVKTSRFEADPDFAGFMGDFNDDPLAGTKGTNTSGRMYLPFYGNLDFLLTASLGVAEKPPESKWTFAYGSYVPFGVGITHGDANDPARFGGKAIGRQHLIYAAPSASYQLSDTLSFGFSVGFGQTAMSAEVDMRSPHDMVALTRVLGKSTKDLEIPVVSELTFPPPWFGGGVSPYDQVASFDLRERDNFSPSFNLGMLWSPAEWFSFGAVYQSPIKAQLSGRYRFDYTDVWQRMVNWFGSSPLLMEISGMLDLPTRAVPEQSGFVTSNVEFPQRVQLGIMLRPFKSLRLMADLHWANWSVMDKEEYQFDQKIQLLQVVKLLGYTGGDRTLVLQRHWQDTWEYSFGLEYQALDWLALRLGYQPRKSAVPDNYFDLIYALPDLDLYSCGLGITLKSGTQIDLGFGYLVNKGYRIKDGESHNLNSYAFADPVYNPYAGLNYEQDTETYLYSLNISMPLQTMEEMLDSQLEMASHLISWLNPFD